ncbi:PP10 [Orf virus]|uniref:PP10 n=1 Tax=Orf virus TaxID=10258 RepID=F1AXH4_ORFV|nr:PP10 [Orf virus]
MTAEASISSLFAIVVCGGGLVVLVLGVQMLNSLFLCFHHRSVSKHLGRCAEDVALFLLLFLGGLANTAVVVLNAGVARVAPALVAAVVFVVRRHHRVRGGVAVIFAAHTLVAGLSIGAGVVVRIGTRRVRGRFLTGVGVRPRVKLNALVLLHALRGSRRLIGGLDAPIRGLDYGGGRAGLKHLVSADEERRRLGGRREHTEPVHPRLLRGHVHHAVRRASILHTRREGMHGSVQEEPNGGEDCRPHHRGERAHAFSAAADRTHAHPSQRGQADLREQPRGAVAGQWRREHHRGAAANLCQRPHRGSRDVRTLAAHALVVDGEVVRPEPRGALDLELRARHDNAHHRARQPHVEDHVAAPRVRRPAVAEHGGAAREHHVPGHGVHGRRQRLEVPRGEDRRQPHRRPRVAQPVRHRDRDRVCGLSHEHVPGRHLAAEHEAVPRLAALCVDAHLAAEADPNREHVSRGAPAHVLAVPELHEVNVPVDARHSVPQVDLGHEPLDVRRHLAALAEAHVAAVHVRVRAAVGACRRRGPQQRAFQRNRGWRVQAPRPWRAQSLSGGVHWGVPVGLPQKIIFHLCEGRKREACATPRVNVCRRLSVGTCTRMPRTTSGGSAHGHTSRDTASTRLVLCRISRSRAPTKSAYTRSFCSTWCTRGGSSTGGGCAARTMSSSEVPGSPTTVVLSTTTSLSHSRTKSACRDRTRAESVPPQSTTYRTHARVASVGSGCTATSSDAATASAGGRVARAARTARVCLRMIMPESGVRPSGVRAVTSAPSAMSREQTEGL